MTDITEELQQEIDSLEDSVEELRDWLRGRREAEALSKVTKPSQHGGSGVGTITIRVSKPGRKCFYTVRPGGTLFVSSQHPNSRGASVVPAHEADDGLLRRAVEYYPKFLELLVEEVNDARTRYEASLPDEDPPGMELSE